MTPLAQSALGRRCGPVDFGAKTFPAWTSHLTRGVTMTRAASCTGASGFHGRVAFLAEPYRDRAGAAGMPAAGIGDDWVSA